MKHSPSTDRATDAEIYREAAKSLETGRTVCGCCYAIHRSGGEGYLPEGRHAQAMNSVFPEGMLGKWGKYEDRNNGPRILALCFMAAMVEAGDA